MLRRILRASLFAGTDYLISFFTVPLFGVTCGWVTATAISCVVLQQVVVEAFVDFVEAKQQSILHVLGVVLSWVIGYAIAILIVLSPLYVPMMLTKNLWVTLLLEIVLVFSVLLFCGWISTLADKNEHSGGGKV